MTSITWINWGSPTAIGYGTSCYVPPGQAVVNCTPQAAEVIASNVGECDGHSAYENVGWFFPGVADEDVQNADGSDVRGCVYSAGD
ncbi:hypothetical protein ACX9R5_05960 [Rathayibacter sp. CAU 1779]